jgi:hypothetical protein
MEYDRDIWHGVSKGEKTAEGRPPCGQSSLKRPQGCLLPPWDTSHHLQKAIHLRQHIIAVRLLKQYFLHETLIERTMCILVYIFWTVPQIQYKEIQTNRIQIFSIIWFRVFSLLYTNLFLTKPSQWLVVISYRIIHRSCTIKNLDNSPNTWYIQFLKIPLERPLLNVFCVKISAF